MINVRVESPNLVPIKKHLEDAGWDLKSTKNHIINYKERVTIHTGVYIAIPRGYMGLVVPRSGKGADEGLVLRNTVGIIDSLYRGEILCKIKNNEEEPLTIEKYERFAQLIIVPVFLDELNIVSELLDTKRGHAGFGSSGKLW